MNLPKVQGLGIIIFRYFKKCYEKCISGISNEIMSFSGLMYTVASQLSKTLHIFYSFCMICFHSTIWTLIFLHWTSPGLDHHEINFEPLNADAYGIWHSLSDLNTFLAKAWAYLLSHTHFIYHILAVSIRLLWLC
jgi:hypothetical protein